jgi:hypothetical protein
MNESTGETCLAGSNGLDGWENGLPSNLWMLSSLLIGFSVVERVRILPVWWYEEGFGDGVGT